MTVLAPSAVDKTYYDGLIIYVYDQYSEFCSLSDPL